MSARRQRIALLVGIIVVLIGAVLLSAERSAGTEPPEECPTTVTAEPAPDDELPCGFTDGIPPGCYPLPDDPAPCDDEPQECTPETCPPGCLDPLDDEPCVWTPEDVPPPTSCDQHAGQGECMLPPPPPVTAEPTFTG